MEALYQHRFQREGVPKSLAEVKDEGEEETDLFRQPELYQDQRPAPGSWAGNGELPRPPRTTYDQLRMQHREAELKKSFRRTPSQLPLAESGPNEGGDDADTRRNNSYERLRYQHRERELKKSFGGTPSQLSYGDSGASEDIDDANSGKNNNYENREREFKKNLSHLLGLGYPDKLGRPTSGGGEKAPEQSVDRSRRKMFNQYGDEILPER